MSNSFFDEKFERDLFESFEKESFMKPQAKIHKQQKTKSKFKPKIDLLAIAEQKKELSQDMGYQMYSSLFSSSTPSGAFEVEDIKISRNGISAIPESTMDSQEAMHVSSSFDKSKSPMRPPPKMTPKKLSDISYEDLIPLGHLGHGASSSVELVQDPKGKQYALKKIAVTRERVKLMYFEVKTLHKCRKCSNIIQMYEAYYRDNQLQILLEFMDMDLETLLRMTKRIPEDILSLILRQILIALQYLHEKRRIIHRDLKPANVLISKTGATKVSDFGLTGIRSGISNEEVFKTCQGTILYMSPERINDQPHSFPCDIWSIGVMCIELSQGHVPFEKRGYFELMEEINNLSKMELSKDLYSPEFQLFIRGCLEVQPEKRWDATTLLNSDFFKKHENVPLTSLENFISQFTQ